MCVELCTVEPAREIFTKFRVHRYGELTVFSIDEMVKYTK